MAHLPPAQLPVPSHVWWRSYLPSAPLMDQWRGVYHSTALSNHLKWTLLMERKRELAKAKTDFNTTTVELALKSKEGKFTDLMEKFKLMIRLNEHGLVEDGMDHFDDLVRKGAVTAEHCAQTIRSLSVPALQTHIGKTEASCDSNLITRLVADRKGSIRLHEGERVFDTVAANFRSIAHYNSLMQLCLSCGYSATKRVSGDIYDAIGRERLQPNITTYTLVIDSLLQQGNVEEAIQVMRFLRANCADQLYKNVEIFNVLMRGFRANRCFDRCDELWMELVDSRRPAPNIETAEQYLRSIVDLSYTPTTHQLNLFGQIHQGEKKRIPLVLVQMERVGIPWTQLSRPLIDEVEDALRKFTITREKFYHWGRAMKLFNFIDFRKANGWAYDLKEVHLQMLQPPLRRPPGATKSDAVAPIGTVELPAEFTEADPWDRLPLTHMLNKQEQKEKYEDSKQSPKWYLDETPLQKRSSMWLSEVPQTRYDTNYGQMKIDARHMGVRRHLFSPSAAENPTSADIKAKDAQILAGSLRSARRVRQAVETQRTHRPSADQ
jgi:pentatricopeptide repeat protein